MKLFVYGTLKRGYGNNRLLQNATFIGEAITNKPYLLFNCGFPKAVPSEEGLPIIGEVFEVDEAQLARCDSLEGHPDWYVRREINANINGREETVMIYEMDQLQQAPMCHIIDNKYYQWGR